MKGILKMKKLFSTLLILSILIAVMPITTSALTEGDWEYDILNSEVIITGYNGAGGDVVVPDKIRNCPVVAVQKKEAIFRDFQKCTSIVLPDSVRIIGDYSFGGSKITKFNMPRALESIGEQAFNNCKNLVSVDFSKVEACPQLGEQIFGGCDLLKDVTLPNNLYEISDYMFASCDSLENIELPKTITRIGHGAFSGAGLSSIILPASLQTVEAAAFSGCDNLKEIIVPYGVTKLGGTLPSLPKSERYGVFTGCDSLESVYIPDTVTSSVSRIIEKSNNAIIYCSGNSYMEDLCKDNSISYIIDNSVNTKINVLYNGKRVSFDAYQQNPEIVNNRTMVPLRSIFETMGASVEWDNSTNTAIATRNNTTVKIQIGAYEIYKNNEKIEMDVPAQIVNGRTMVPVRVIAEVFGANVEWKANGNIVLITE